MVSFWFVRLLFGRLVLTYLKWGRYRTILVQEAQTEHNSLYTDTGVSHVYGDTSRNVVSGTRTYVSFPWIKLSSSIPTGSDNVTP